MSTQVETLSQFNSPEQLIFTKYDDWGQYYEFIILKAKFVLWLNLNVVQTLHCLNKKVYVNFFEFFDWYLSLGSGTLSNNFILQLGENESERKVAEIVYCFGKIEQNVLKFTLSMSGIVHS